MKCDKFTTPVKIEIPGLGTIESEDLLLKVEVDEAIAELKQKLHDAEMQADLAECAVTEYKIDCDKLNDENRKLKRALWISRAKAYRYIAELISCFNPDFIRNRKMFTPNNLKQKQMNSLEWAKLMLKVERKCRAKAE